MLGLQIRRRRGIDAALSSEFCSVRGKSRFRPSAAAGLPSGHCAGDLKLAEAKTQDASPQGSGGPADLPRRLVSDKHFPRRMDRLVGAEKVA